HELARRVNDLEDEREIDADAQVRDDLVCARHIDEPHLAGADAEGKTELRAVPVAVDAQLVHGVDDRVDPYGPRDLQRGEVERLAQRLPDRERPMLLFGRLFGAVAL